MGTGPGLFLPEAHWARRADTALYFGVPLDQAAIATGLMELAQTLGETGKTRVRLAMDGGLTLEAEPPVANAAALLPDRGGVPCRWRCAAGC